MIGKTCSGSDAQYSEEAVKRIVANALKITLSIINNMDAIKNSNIVVEAYYSPTDGECMKMRVVDSAKMQFQTSHLAIDIPVLYCM